MADRWGPWRLDLDAMTLTAHDYPVDLRTCVSSAEVLDWIMQVAGKTWAYDEVVAGLVRAFDDLLQPQATLCSEGRSTTMTVAQVEELVRVRLRTVLDEG